MAIAEWSAAVKMTMEAMIKNPGDRKNWHLRCLTPPPPPQGESAFSDVRLQQIQWVEYRPEAISSVLQSDRPESDTESTYEISGAWGSQALCRIRYQRTHWRPASLIYNRVVLGVK